MLFKYGHYMKKQNETIDKATGKPLDRSYLECDLPEFLNRSLDAMKKSWELLDAGKEDLEWDCNWCELNSDINVACVSQQISDEQGDYLRRKYLRMER